MQDMLDYNYEQIGKCPVYETLPVLRPNETITVQWILRNTGRLPYKKSRVGIRTLKIPVRDTGAPRAKAWVTDSEARSLSRYNYRDEQISVTYAEIQWSKNSSPGCDFSVKVTVRAPRKDGCYLMPCIEVTYNGKSMGMDILTFGSKHYEEMSVRSRSLTPPPSNRASLLSQQNSKVLANATITKRTEATEQKLKDVISLDVQSVMKSAFSLIISGKHTNLTFKQQELVVEVWTVLFLLTQMQKNIKMDYAVDEIENIKSILDFVRRILSGMKAPVMKIMERHSILRANGTTSVSITCVLGEIMGVMCVKAQVINIVRNASHYACMRINSAMHSDYSTANPSSHNNRYSDAKLFVEDVLQNEEKVGGVKFKAKVMLQRMNVLIDALSKNDFGSSIRDRLSIKERCLLQKGILSSIEKDRTLFAKLNDHYINLGMKSKILLQYSGKYLLEDSKLISDLQRHLKNVEVMCQWMNRISTQKNSTLPLCHYGHMISFYVKEFLRSTGNDPFLASETKKLAMYVIETLSPLFFNLKMWISNDKILMCCMHALAYDDVDRLLRNIEFAQKKRRINCVAFEIMADSVHEMLR